LQKGKRVLMIESGIKVKPGLVEHHSLLQTKWQFKNAGLNFIWGLKPILFAEGKTLGGGSEVNSGLYHRLQGAHREKILRSLQVDENEWAELEKLVESELSIQLDPESVEPDHGLVLGARHFGLAAEEVPRWRKYSPSIEHQSMQVTYLYQARNLGLRVVSNVQATRLLPTEKRIEVIAKSVKQSQISFFAKEVVLAAGAVETPRILNNSKISNKSFKLNFHPMVRGVGEQSFEINQGDLFPSWQAWTHDLRLKYGYSVSTYPYLAATLQSMGERSNYNEKKLSRMAAYFGSFAIKDSRVLLAKLGGRLVPIIWWGQNDKRTLNEVKVGLKALLIAGGAIDTWPKNHHSAVTTVHIFGSIPIGNQDLFDASGKLKSDPRIRISDASLMPHAPWGNPQGPIMVMCELLARRV
jgi:choline dehydrogenase-like flavoprotein